jgi:hypothetical protein
MHNQTVSIGYEREDGDFHIIATLNNNEEFAEEADWYCAIAAIVKTLQKVMGLNLAVLEREDAPDFVNLDKLEDATIVNGARPRD